MEGLGVQVVTMKVKEAQQLYLFEDEKPEKLDARLWHGSFNGRESTLQQLSPYVGKMKSGMAKILINMYSPDDGIVLDPFSGSGVVPLEAVLAGRQAWANDLSPYAYALTRGKIETPGQESVAIQRAKNLADMVERDAHKVDISVAPEWVREFYDPATLREIILAFQILRQHEDYFLIACLLGILHHVRPGFLSYPASHLVPYLRKAKYPPDHFPKMYAYRDLRSRLLAKVKRAYRRSFLPQKWEQREYKIWQANAMNLPVEHEAVDTIISSPPYFGALDYARDNRLRLWFLGCEDWKQLDASLTANSKVYLNQMAACLKEMSRVLKPDGYCVLVLGDVERDGKTHRTAEILGEIAAEVTQQQLITELIYDDRIPDERRSRRLTQTTKYERILVMKKVSAGHLS
jgi:DNA modification methylase